MGGLYVALAMEVLPQAGHDPVQFLHQCAVDQLEVARRLQAPPDDTSEQSG